MYDSIKTPADLDALPTPVILDIFNKLTGKSTKKFNTRAKGVEQTFKALQASRSDIPTATDAKPTKAKKVTKTNVATESDSPVRKRKVSGVPKHTGLSFRMAPQAPKVFKRRTKSTRSQILDFLCARATEGETTTLNDVRKQFSLNRKDGYEHIRNLNWYWGLGLWSDIDETDTDNCTIEIIDGDEFNARVATLEEQE